MAQTKINIIVAEDDAAMAEIVSHKLTASGYDVRHAENGLRAVEMCEESAPDLMLLDLMMPEMDGFQVLAKIRGSKDKKLASLPIIVLSNLWSNEDILKTQALKVDGYMVKAYFTPDEILGKIREVLSSKK
ncbi:MAG: response regulator transcription factor [Candidatus Doudnabacteria bacterium]|nr:response regulator transcription factor [Candidatus Doudnabacteria bacterium]